MQSGSAWITGALITVPVGVVGLIVICGVFELAKRLSSRGRPARGG